VEREVATLRDHLSAIRDELAAQRERQSRPIRAPMPPSTRRAEHTPARTGSADGSLHHNFDRELAARRREQDAYAAERAAFEAAKKAQEAQKREYERRMAEYNAQCERLVRLEKIHANLIATEQREMIRRQQIDSGALRADKDVLLGKKNIVAKFHDIDKQRAEEDAYFRQLRLEQVHRAHAMGTEFHAGVKQHQRDVDGEQKLAKHRRDEALEAVRWMEKQTHLPPMTEAQRRVVVDDQLLREKATFQSEAWKRRQRQEYAMGLTPSLRS